MTVDDIAFMSHLQMPDLFAGTGFQFASFGDYAQAIEEVGLGHRSDFYYVVFFFLQVNLNCYDWHFF